MSESVRSGAVSAEVDRLAAEVVAEITDRLHAGEPVDIDAYTARHPELADQLRHLLPALQLLDHFSSSASPGGTASADGAERGGTLGDFRIVREVGRGGMGVVYEAEQLSLRRRVALKVLPFAATMDPRHLQRFQNEARAAACLDHPHIVKVHAVGCERGIHYFAMKFIEGQSLAELIAAQKHDTASGGRQPPDGLADQGADAPRSPVAATQPVAVASTQSAPRDAGHFRRIAEWGIQAAEALEHAHSLGIVHRDIKPANLMIDGAGKLWVTDFGLARTATDAGLTMTGDVVGTLRYMSPEQALAKHGLVDHRTDIYVLGATLYELLTLRPAIDGEDRGEILRKIAFEEPASPRSLDRAIPADLESIVLKALAKDPADRYSTAQELADELQRYLQGRPLQLTCPVRWWERFWRWCRRNPALASVSILALAALLAATVVSLVFAFREAQNAKTLGQALADSEANRRQAELRLAENCLERSLTLWEQGEFGSGMLWLGRSLEIAPADATDLQRVIRTNLAGWGCQLPSLKALLEHQGMVGDAAFSPDGRTALIAGGSTARLWDTATGNPLGPALRHQDAVNAAAFSPDGRTVLTASADHTAQLWDVATGQPLGPPLRHKGPVRPVAFSPDGRTVCTGSEDKTARLWDMATGKPLCAPLPHHAAVLRMAFSPDGKTILTVSQGSQAAQPWEVATGRPLGPPLVHPGKIHTVAFSPDGRTILTGGWDATGWKGEARLWDAATAKSLDKIFMHQSGVQAAVFSPDGRTILTGSTDNTARLWEVATGKPRGLPLVHRGWVHAVAFSPDGRTVLTGGQDNTARLWEAATGKPLGPPLQHTSVVLQVSFSPDGQTILTRTWEKVVRLWVAIPGKRFHKILRHPAGIWAAVFSPDGRTILTGCVDGSARLWDTASGKPVGKPLRHRGRVFRVAFSPDGRLILTGSEDHTAQLWKVATCGPLGPPLQHQDEVWAVAFSPDGKMAVTASNDGLARLWDTATGQAITAPLRHHVPIRCAGFSPDGRLVLTASFTDQQARLWDASTGKPHGLPLQHPDSIWTAAFSPDGRTIVTGCIDSAARVWDVATGKCHDPPLQHRGRVVDVAFSPDSRTVLTGSLDSTARIWDVATGKALSPPLRHRGLVQVVAFSPDGRVVLTGSADKTARLWDAATGKPLGPPLGHDGQIFSVAFSPDGRTVLTGSDDGSARLWEVPTPVNGEVERIVLWIQVMTGLELDSDGVIQVLDPQVWEQRRRRLAEMGGPP